MLYRHWTMTDDANTLQHQLDDVRNALRLARQLIGTNVSVSPPNLEAHIPVVEI